MALWLALLIVVAAGALLTGALVIGRKNPSAEPQDQLRRTDPRAAETLDELGPDSRNLLPMHDRSFDPPR
jgi:hypothetical protein